jgi:hypothetical protein
MTRIWRKLLLAATVALTGTVVANISTASAAPATVYVFNTDLASNTGLAFCDGVSTKGCIDSVVIDGQNLTPVTNRLAANFVLAGGLYGPQCRFVETDAAPCELPYMVIYPSTNGIPTQAPVGEVTVNFRRAQNNLATTRIGTTVVNGTLKSFTPAAPGIRDISTVVASPATIHRASSPSSSWCAGWVIAIDLCTIPETATSKVTNTVSILLLPGMRSSIVPPDKTDPTCVPSIVNGCIIPVFEETSFGGWMDTDAYLFGMTSADRDTGASQMKIAGPHFKLPENGVSSELNQSFIRSYIPAAFLLASFGLTPQQANAQTLPITRTIGFNVSTPTSTYTPVDGGLLLNTIGVGFSTPTVSIQRVLVVKKNKTLTADQLLRAAGVYNSKRFGAAKITTNLKAGMKKVGGRYLFTKVRSLKVSLRYKSTAVDTSFRDLSVKVVK